MSRKSISTKIQKLTWGQCITLFKNTVTEFASENSLFHGAALSYYTIFALVPILYLSIVSFGAFIGQEKMQSIISDVLTKQIGIKDVHGIMSFLNEIDFHKTNFILQTVGVIVLLVSSTAILSSLKYSINDFYDIQRVHTSKKKLLFSTLKDRLVHVLLLMFFGTIIIITYFAQLVIISFGDKLFSDLHGLRELFSLLTQHFIPFITNVIIFYFVLKYVSDGLVHKRLAFAGSIVTATLLYLGQLGIKFYLTNYFFAKDAGIAGTILILLAWVYYTSQIIFFGAKFTSEYAKILGQPIQVKK
jgi:membrane protein